MPETSITLELSTAFMLALGVVNLLVLGPVAWILKGALSDLRQLQRDHNALKEDLPKNYVPKIDYRADVGELKRLIEGLYDIVNGRNS